MRGGSRGPHVQTGQVSPLAPPAVGKIDVWEESGERRNWSSPSFIPWPSAIGCIFPTPQQKRRAQTTEKPGWQDVGHGGSSALVMTWLVGQLRSGSRCPLVPCSRATKACFYPSSVSTSTVVYEVRNGPCGVHNQPPLGWLVWGGLDRSLHEDWLLLCMVWCLVCLSQSVEAPWLPSKAPAPSLTMCSI